VAEWATRNASPFEPNEFHYHGGETAHEIIIIVLTELIAHNAAIPGGALSGSVERWRLSGAMPAAGSSN
jgi:hypothetical protein